VSKKLKITLLIACLATIVGLGAWYAMDRNSFITTTCEIGLGNLSRPDELGSDEVGCSVIGPKMTVQGILITGFEASNFSSEAFDPVKGWPETEDQRAWFNCPEAGCGAALEQQLSENPFQGCLDNDSFGTRIATVEAEGWATVSQNAGYGHLNRYPREFWATKIVKVSPPPKK
jgi:hypothetical protein